jgi:hypothetical protein
MGGSATKATTGSKSATKTTGTTSGKLPPRTDCDKAVQKALTSCDFVGGMPKWNRRSPQSLPPTCDIPSKYVTNFNDHWGKGLGGCTQFKKEGDSIVYSHPDNASLFHQAKFVPYIDQINAMLVEIKRDMDGMNEAKRESVYKHVVAFLKELNMTDFQLHYTFKNGNETIPVVYKWVSEKGLKRLLHDLKQLHAAAKPS